MVSSRCFYLTIYTSMVVYIQFSPWPRNKNTGISRVWHRDSLLILTEKRLQPPHFGKIRDVFGLCTDTCSLTHTHVNYVWCLCFGCYTNAWLPGGLFFQLFMYLCVSVHHYSNITLVCVSSTPAVNVTIVCMYVSVLCVFHRNIIFGLIL